MSQPPPLKHPGSSARIGVLEPGDALLIIDVQLDFLPGGQLPVPEGDRIIDPLNRAIRTFTETGRPVFATRDWHPADHCSFTRKGGIWPPHCVANTPGAEFAPGLDLPVGARVFSKGAGADRDAYSGFEGTDLEQQLRAAGARRIFVGGLATDYCVLSTVRDALRLGFDVVLLADCMRAVNLHPGDGASALDRMRALGARESASGVLDTGLESDLRHSLETSTGEPAPG